jgi:hypothetical protein
MNDDRRSQPRDTADRRQAREFRLVIPRELRDGWLAIQGSAEKLRLSPIPDGWTHLSDAELAVLVERANQLPRLSHWFRDEHRAAAGTLHSFRLN